MIDIGDGVACLEFHSKMNAIGADTISMMNYSVKEVGENLEALVIGDRAEPYIGANVVFLLLEIRKASGIRWDVGAPVPEREYESSLFRKPVVAPRKG